MRFLGNIEAKIDAKGRVFLPAIFRKVLQASGQDSLVLRKDIFSDCLVLYPEEVWNEQLDALQMNLNRWNRTHRQLLRQFESDAEAMQLDGQGRLLLPKRYLQMAHIRQDIKFIGVDDTIEIWSKENTVEPFMQPDEFSQTIERVMAGVVHYDAMPDV